MTDYLSFVFMERFEFYDTIGSIFEDVKEVTVDLSVAERIWELI